MTTKTDTYSSMTQQVKVNSSIWRHSAATSSGTLTIDLHESDFVATALTTSSEIGLAKSPWSAVEAWDVNDIDGLLWGYQIVICPVDTMDGSRHKGHVRY